MPERSKPPEGSTSASRGEIPPRSIFYPLAAKALNTPLVESLTGYLRRLAGTHGVSVVDLICHELFDDLFPETADRRTRRHLFQAEAYQLDGARSFDQRWISRIEAGTVQSDLRNSTLWPFVDATHSSWLRRRRAWCPHCLMEWDLATEEPYDPLLWSIRIVTVCPIDLTPLTEVCPHCSKSASPFAGAPFPGICGRCGEKLWVPKKQLNRLGSVGQDKYAIWCASEMLSVIGALGEFAVPLIRGSIANLLSAKVAAVEKQKLGEKIVAAGCSKRSTYLWAFGAVVPRVETLFQLCFQLNLRPVDLLREATGLSPHTLAEERFASGHVTCQIQVQGGFTGSSATLSEQAVFPFATTYSRANPDSSLDVLAVRPDPVRNTERVKRMPRQMSFPFSEAKSRGRVTYQQTARSNQIRNRLNDALLSEPPPSLHAVAKSLNMSSSTWLREIEPELTRQLTHVGQKWEEKQEAAIRAVFEAPFDSERPLSLERFCRSRGISYSVIRRDYPDIKDAYSARFRMLRLEAAKVRATARIIAVAEAVNKIRRHGDYPSVDRVKSTSPELKAAGWDEIQAAIRSADLISQRKKS